MLVATHRVVGVLEWPTGSDFTSELLARIERQGSTETSSGQRILSLRLPVSDDASSTVLSADIASLRNDLQRLFDDFLTS